MVISSARNSFVFSERICYLNASRTCTSCCLQASATSGPKSAVKDNHSLDADLAVFEASLADFATSQRELDSKLQAAVQRYVMRYNDVQGAKELLIVPTLFVFVRCS